MVDEEDAIQGDDGALSEGGEAAQAGAAGGAVGDLGMIAAFGDGRIDLGDAHGVLRCSRVRSLESTTGGGDVGFAPTVFFRMGNGNSRFVVVSLELLCYTVSIGN
jgi:hypothetical protein